MDFEEWAAERVMSSMEKEFAHAAWEDATKAPREMAMTAILEECPNDGSYAEIILRRAWDRVRTMRSNIQKCIATTDSCSRTNWCDKVALY